LPPSGNGARPALACQREGFDCIAVEQEAEYVEDARRRLVSDAGMFADVEVAG